MPQTRVTEWLPPTERSGVGSRSRWQLDGDNLRVIAQDERVERAKDVPIDAVVSRIVDDDRLSSIDRFPASRKILSASDSNSKLQYSEMDIPRN